MSNFAHEKKIKITLTLIIIINIFLCVDGFLWIDRIFQDFLGQWKLCAYTLRGIDPYPLIGSIEPEIESIGIIPSDWRAAPWGLLLGNLFYPGFMPVELAASMPAGSSDTLSFTNELLVYRSTNTVLEPAEIYFFVINAIFLIAVAAIIFATFKNLSLKFAIVSSVLAIFSFNFMFPLIQAGNAEGCIDCLLILSGLLWNKYPKLTGIFLAIAMIKPQTALIFCFALLLLRQFKTLFIAALIDILAWVAVSFMTGTSPLILMTEFFSSSFDSVPAYSGIFTLMFIPNFKVATGLSMLAGIVYVYIFHRLMSDCRIEEFKLFPACIASTFWCYSAHACFYILTLPIIICVYILIKSKNLWQLISVFSVEIFLSVGFLICLGFFDDISQMLDGMPWREVFLISDDVIFWVNVWIMRTFLEIGFIFIGVYLWKRLRDLKKC